MAPGYKYLIDSVAFLPLRTIIYSISTPRGDNPNIEQSQKF